MGNCWGRLFDEGILTPPRCHRGWTAVDLDGRRGWMHWRPREDHFQCWFIAEADWQDNPDYDAWRQDDSDRMREEYLF